MIPKRGSQRMSSTVSTGITHKLAARGNFGGIQRMSSTGSTGASHKYASNTSLMVNHRYMGQRGELSQNFGSVALTTRDKLQLRSLMIKSSVAGYENNLIAQRRMEQKIAQKVSEVYGLDPKRMMGSIHNGCRNNCKPKIEISNKLNNEVNNRSSLADKVNGKTK